MIRLVPSWVENYDEFWISIRRRNLWFIQLRYLAVLMLILFFSFSDYFIEFTLDIKQIEGIYFTAGIILLYNVLIHYFRGYVGTVPGSFNSLHLSFIQTILDLVSVIFLIYFTGIIYSPFLTFVIFQLIIGSLILPGRVIISIAFILNVIIISLLFMQHYGEVESHIIRGIYEEGISPTFNFTLMTAITLSFINFVSVLLTNTIARRLYQREKELKETLSKLNETEVAKQKYIMGVVHELKSPISAVQSLLDLILGGYVGKIDPEMRKKIERAKVRTEESIQMINNVLRISKIRLLSSTSNEFVNMNEIIENQISKQEDSASAKKIKVSFSEKRDSDRLVSGDYVLIELVISNLLNNAIKYGKNGGRVIIESSEEKGAYFLSIMDDGIGIPKDDQSKIFKQFFRSKSGSSYGVEGTGLGLSVVKEILDRLGGEIDFESPSRIGDDQFPGTEFKIRLNFGDETLIPHKDDKVFMGREI